MIHNITLIRRADFIDLYKFGFFYLENEKIVQYDGAPSELSKRDDISIHLKAHLLICLSALLNLIIQMN